MLFKLTDDGCGGLFSWFAAVRLVGKGLLEVELLEAVEEVLVFDMPLQWLL